jgi:ankyrin repeat protein
MTRRGIPVWGLCLAVLLIAVLAAVAALAAVLLPIYARARQRDLNERLHTAAILGHRDLAERLLASGADVNFRDNVRGTPLHWAALYGHRDVVELLLAHGADVNARTDNGLTPLSWAKLGHPDIAALLEQHGAKQ